MSSQPKNALPQAFLEALRSQFHERFSSQDPSDRETYGRDWTKVFAPAPSLVCFPQSTEEVARLLKLCWEHGVAVVPSGGRTGLSGGAVAAQGEVVLTLERMRSMGAVDTASRTVRVEAGSVTQAVHEHCAPEGLTWPVDFASKGSSTVGGNIATNAGGVRVIRYGLTRNWVLGLEVVLADGRVLQLNGALEKNQTGLDLRQLFIGSEGTLGVVTAATLKLAPLPVEPQVFFFALPDLPSVLKLFRHVRRSPWMVNAFEFLGRNCLEAVRAHRGLTPPYATESAYSVLLEIESPEGETAGEKLQAWLEELFEKELVQDGTWAQSRTEAENLWALREGISESLAAKTLLHKHDISVPVAQLEPFIDSLLSDFSATYQGFEVFLFGHIGDGNLHLNIGKPPAMEKADFLGQTRAIDARVFERVAQHQGSVSAEHGIGLLKKHGLKFSRSEEEMALMRSIKAALDPKGILNPGKILDPQ